MVLFTVVVIVDTIAAVIINPIIYWVWAVIAPKSAAFLYKAGKGREFFFFPRQINKVSLKLLPWGRKKIILRESMLKGASLKDQVRFGLTDSTFKAIDSNWLSDEAKKIIWEQGYDSHRAKLLSQMGTLTEEQFNVLLEKTEWNTIKTYSIPKTISCQCLLMLVRKAKSCNEARNTLSFIARKSSLPSKVVEVIFGGSDEATKEEISLALREFSHKKAVERFPLNINASALWRDFLKELKSKGENLHPEAQKALNLEQYQEFKKQGFSMDVSAVEYHLSKSQHSLLVEEVIKNELLAEGTTSEKIEKLIAANPLLLERKIFLIRYKSGK